MKRVVTVPGSEIVELPLETERVADKVDEAGGRAAAFPELEDHVENMMLSAQMVDFAMQQAEVEVMVSKSEFAGLASMACRWLDSLAAKASKEVSELDSTENTVKAVETGE